jgi:methyl-accepting chemotaxis protein
MEKAKQKKVTKKVKQVGNETKVRGTSMKAKLLGIIIPVVIALIVVLVLFSYTISSNSIEKTSKNLLQLSVAKQSTQIEAWLDENLSAFQSAKTAIEQVKPDNKQMQKILDGYYNFDSDFPDGLYMADSYGTYLKASESKKVESRPTKSVWYIQGLSRVNMGFTTAYTNYNGEPVISASGILNDGSGTIKVLSADLSLNKISIIVNSAIDMEDAASFLVDSSDGTILAHRDASLISKKISENKEDAYLSQVATKLKDKSYDYCELNGMMTVFQKVSGTNWMLVSYIPKSTVMADVNSLRLKMLLMGLFAIVVLSVLIERVTDRTIRPVKKLTKIITRMSDGDFTVKVDVHGNDEIGQMSRSVEKFIESMKLMLTDISGISQQLLNQSENSDEVSQNMYDAAQTQSQSMSELNTTVDQLSVSVNEIAESATRLAMVVADTQSDSAKVDLKMKDTVAVSQQGRTDMEHVSSAMQDIHDSINKLGEAVNKVGNASEEITKIVGLIGAIAEETDLLSLNASIEAARAGEMGRGFAVVASQIGNLAKTSADSVEHITKLINEIRNLVADAVQQAAESTDNINNSSEMINIAVNTFDSIYKDIFETNTLINQVIEKVNEVDQVATNVAAIAEEQAASSDGTAGKCNYAQQ